MPSLLVLAAVLALTLASAAADRPPSSLQYRQDSVHTWTAEYPVGVTSIPVHLPLRLPRVPGLRIRALACGVDVATSVQLGVQWQSLFTAGHTSVNACSDDDGLDVSEPGLLSALLVVHNRGSAPLRVVLSVRFSDEGVFQPGYQADPVPDAAVPRLLPYIAARVRDLLHPAQPPAPLSLITSLGSMDAPAALHAERWSVQQQWDGAADTCNVTQLVAPPRMPWATPGADAVFLTEAVEPVPIGVTPRPQPCRLYEQSLGDSVWRWCFVAGHVWNVQHISGGEVVRWDAVYPDAAPLVAPSSVCSAHDVCTGGWGVPEPDMPSSCACLAPDWYAGPACDTLARCRCSNALPGAASCRAARYDDSPQERLDGASCRCGDGWSGAACDVPACGLPFPHATSLACHVSEDGTVGVGCAPGWAGSACDQSACADAPCRENHVCTGDGTCVCRPLYVSPTGECLDHPYDRSRVIRIDAAAAAANNGLVEFAPTAPIVLQPGDATPVVYEVQTSGTPVSALFSTGSAVQPDPFTRTCIAVDRVPDPRLGDCTAVPTELHGDAAAFPAKSFYYAVYPADAHHADVLLIRPYVRVVMHPPPPPPHAPHTSSLWSTLALVLGAVVLAVVLAWLLRPLISQHFPGCLSRRFPLMLAKPLLADQDTDGYDALGAGSDGILSPDMVSRRSGAPPEYASAVAASSSSPHPPRMSFNTLYRSATAALARTVAEIDDYTPDSQGSQHRFASLMMDVPARAPPSSDPYFGVFDTPRTASMRRSSMHSHYSRHARNASAPPMFTAAAEEAAGMFAAPRRSRRLSPAPSMSSSSRRSSHRNSHRDDNRSSSKSSRRHRRPSRSSGSRHHPAHDHQHSRRRRVAAYDL